MCGIETRGMSIASKDLSKISTALAKELVIPIFIFISGKIGTGLHIASITRHVAKP